MAESTKIGSFDEHESQILLQMRMEMDSEYRRNFDRYPDFYSHPLSQIADAFRQKPSVGGVATAAALALVGAHVNVLSRLTPTMNAHAVRAFVVMLGESGHGKTSVIKALEYAREKARTSVGYLNEKPKSDAALFDKLILAGTKEIVDQDGKSVRVALDENEAPKNALLIIDEAGKFLLSAGQNGKCGDMDSSLCLAFDDRVTIPCTLTSASRYPGLPSRVQANATVLMGATMPQWIKYAATEDDKNGMIRRRLVFIAENKDKTDGLHRMILRENLYESNECRLCKYADALGAIPQKAVFTMTSDARAQADAITKDLLEADIPQGAWITLVVNTATLCAVARVALEHLTEYEVTMCDVCAAHDILKASVCATRTAIKDAVEEQEMARFKSDDAIWKEITDWIGTGRAWHNAVRKYRMPRYRKILDQMIARGDLVRTPTDGKHYAVRVATDEEREEAERRRDDAAQSVFDGRTAP